VTESETETTAASTPAAEPTTPESTPPPLAPAAATFDDSLGSDAILDALWNRVLDAWDDDKIHASLLEHAIRNQQLPDLAGRYRALEKDEAKAPLAKKKLDGIVVAATQMLFATKSAEREAIPKSINRTMMGIVAFVFALVIYAFLRAR
jgi:hypothetical protein